MDIVELICPECKSVIEFRKSDVEYLDYLYCPVCGVKIWVSTILVKRYEDEKKEEVVYKPITCDECDYNDGYVYTSYPPKRKCLVTNHFYTCDHQCHLSREKKEEK